jgi:hypothetical protein
MSKNVVENEGPQMTSQYGAYAMNAELARLHAHVHAPGYRHSRTHTYAHTYQLVILTDSPRQQLFRVTLHVHCLSFLKKYPQITACLANTLLCYYTILCYCINHAKHIKPLCA